MNTLNKNITRQFFLDSDGYDKMVARWSEYCQDKELRKTLTVNEHAAYAILRGKDWRKGFTDITNSVKLANGAGSARHSMRWQLHCRRWVNHPVFEGLLVPNVKDLVYSLMSKTPDDEAYDAGVVASKLVAA